MDSRLGEMELGAARALAELAKIEKSRNDLNESRSELECLVDYHQDNKAAEVMMKERVKIERDSESPISNISRISNHGSCFGRRMKQDMTEAEREAKRIRRVLANRESARQTIRRRQALREELYRRVAELSLENENIKMEKDLVMKEYNSLKDTNKKLKDQVLNAIKANVEIGKEIKPTSPSTELSLVAPCPSISASTTCYEGAISSNSGSSNPHFYVPTYTLFYPLVQQKTCESYPSTSPHIFIHCPQVEENLDRTTLNDGNKVNAIEEKKNIDINLEETPTDLDHHNNKIFQHDPGGIVATKDEKEMDININCDEIESFAEEKSQVAMKKVVDPTAAAAARRRRKELTKLKYHHGKQIRLHG